MIIPSQMLSIPFRKMLIFFCEQLLNPRSTPQREETYNACSLLYMVPNYSVNGLRKFLPLLICLRTSVIRFIIVKWKTDNFLWNYTNYMPAKNACRYKMFRKLYQLAPISVQFSISLLPGSESRKNQIYFLCRKYVYFCGCDS
jgi:hypothetical protein